MNAIAIKHETHQGHKNESHDAGMSFLSSGRRDKTFATEGKCDQPWYVVLV